MTYFFTKAAQSAQSSGHLVVLLDSLIFDELIPFRYNFI